MNEEEIRKKIKEVEEQLEKTEINITTAEYFDKLLEMHKNLWDFLYFKVNSEKNFLVK